MPTVGAVTDFADLGMVLPVAGLVALALAAIGRRRVAFAWLFAVAGTLATMGILKVLAFTLSAPYLAGYPGGSPGLGNPSGHTAAASVFYGGLAMLVGDRLARWPLAGVLAGAAAGLVFGMTRLWLGVHSVPDVLLGGTVGLGGVLVFAWLLGWPRPEAPARLRGQALVLVAVVGGMLVFHGTRLNAEGLLRSIATEIRLAAL